MKQDCFMRLWGTSTVSKTPQTLFLHLGGSAGVCKFDASLLHGPLSEKLFLKIRAVFFFLIAKRICSCYFLGGQK